MRCQFQAFLYDLLVVEFPIFAVGQAAPVVYIVAVFDEVNIKYKLMRDNYYYAVIKNIKCSVK